MRLILFLYFLTLTAFGQNVPSDTFTFGKPASGIDKTFNFNATGGAKSLKWDEGDSQFIFSDDLKITSGDVFLGPSGHQFRINAGKIEFSNDGVIFTPLSGGGISPWETAFPYEIDAVVIEGGEIYQALTNHTSGVFATDLAGGDWVKIADTVQAEGQADTAFTAKTISAPNKTVTSLGGSKALIETGNKNILANPSFEHSTYDTSWTCSGTGTESAEASVVVDGEKSLEIATSAQTIDCLQSSTQYAAQFSGLQGVATAWVKTNDTTGVISVCSLVNGSEDQCVAVTADNVWREYVIPFVMGGTSSGVKVKGTSGTGSTFVDDAFVGLMPATMTPEVAQPEVQSYRVHTLAGYGSTNTMIPYFSTAVSNVGSGIVTIGNDSTLGFSITALKDCVVNIDLSYDANTGEFFGFSLNSNQLTTGLASITTANKISNAAQSSSGIADQLSVSVFLNAGDVLRPHSHSAPAASTAARFHLNFTAIHYPPKNKIFSTCNGVDCENTYSARIANNGTATIVSQSGSAIASVSRFAAGTVDITFTTGFFSVIPSVTASIVGAIDNTDTSIHVTDQSTTLVRIVTEYNPTGTATDFDFNIVIQRQGADNNKNQITGTFKDVVTSPNSSNGKPVKYCATSNAAGTIDEGENRDWINGNASLSDTSLYALTFNSGIFLTSSDVFCQFTILNSGDATLIGGYITAQSATGVTYRTRRSTTEAKDTGSGFNFCCHGVQ